MPEESAPKNPSAKTPNIDGLEAEADVLQAQLTDIESQANAIIKDARRTDETADELDKKRQIHDRSAISIIIISAFAIGLGFFILFIIVGAWSSSCADADKAKCAWAHGGTMILDALKSVLLPVVTLVLGYYFGIAKK